MAETAAKDADARFIVVDVFLFMLGTTDFLEN
jgi:hypothetical protein